MFDCCEWIVTLLLLLFHLLPSLSLLSVLMLEECIEGDGEVKNDGNKIPEPESRVFANKFEDQS